MRRAVFVVGPTGSGKSRLGIEIACACNGEVISADAIQLYRGLDVATAKVPQGERRGIAHHLMSFLPPRGAMTVRDFRAMASAVIDDVLARGKLPVVVGGTGYYVQALLKESLLEEDESAAREGGGGGGGGGGGEGGGAHSPTPGAEGPGWGGHARLSTVDPLMASRLHPNDTRRIHRALHVYDTTGVPYSTVLERQAARLAAAAAAAVDAVAAEAAFR
jgi:tRNA dimethylallyltransferase